MTDPTSSLSRSCEAALTDPQWCNAPTERDPGYFRAWQRVSLALQRWLWPQLAPWLPGPRLFGVVILPLAVAALALAEFALRPRLLPQAPRHRLHTFATGLVRAWPAILSE